MKSGFALWLRLLALSAAYALIAPAARAQEPQISPEVFSSPGRGQVLAPGSIVEIRWSPDCDSRRDGARDPEGPEPQGEREANEAELLLSLDGGNVFAVRISTELFVGESHFRWIVPALPSTHARLALREGFGGQPSSEAIRVLSEEFTILPDPEGRREDLYERAGEWWTRPALALDAAEDRLARTMCADGAVRAESRRIPEAAGSGVSGAVASPDRRRAPREPETSISSPAARPAEARRPFLVALRL